MIDARHSGAGAGTRNDPRSLSRDPASRSQCRNQPSPKSITARRSILCVAVTHPAISSDSSSSAQRRVGLAGDDSVVGGPYSAGVVHTAQIPLPLAATFFAAAFFGPVFFVGAFDFTRA